MQLYRSKERLLLKVKHMAECKGRLKGAASENFNNEAVATAMVTAGKE